MRSSKRKRCVTNDTANQPESSVVNKEDVVEPKDPSSNTDSNLYCPYNASAMYIPPGAPMTININQQFLNSNNLNPYHTMATNGYMSQYLPPHLLQQIYNDSYNTKITNDDNIKSSKTNEYTTIEHLNTVAANTSSYFCLTPASSTTSLNDLNQCQQQLNNKRKNTSTAITNDKSNLSTKQSATSASSLVRTHSKKRARNIEPQTSIDELQQPKTVGLSSYQSETALTVASTKPVRRRGRPPKSATQSTTTLPALSSAAENKIEKYFPLPVTIETEKENDQFKSTNSYKRSSTSSSTIGLSRYNSTDSTTTTNNPKLIKSLINKSSSNSNLQKSKVLINTTTASNNVASSNGLLTTTINVNTTNTTEIHYQQQQQQLPQIYQQQQPLNINTNYINSNTNGYVVMCNQRLYQSNLLQISKPIAEEEDQQQDEQDQIDYEKDKKSNLQLASQNAHLFYENYNKNLNSKLKSCKFSKIELNENNNQTPMPNLNWANSADLWQTMKWKDSKYKHDHLYLDRHIGIEPQMRAILLDWLMEISYAYRLHRETWHLAVEYMDRFMTECKQQMRVDRLQLIGMTSLFLAAKVEEIYPPKLKDFASHMESYSNNNEDAISQFELFILKSLEWEISPVTANTWLMTYLQIASINYYNYLSSNNNSSSASSVSEGCNDKFMDTKEHNSHVVMPLHIYKNSSSMGLGSLSKTHFSPNQTTLVQQQFYLNNYMKSVTLLDLCMFDMESMKFNYSVLAASAMYHMISKPINSTNNSATSLSPQMAATLVQRCTGFKLHELDACIKWMYPYAEVCKDILTDEKMTNIKQFSNIDPDDAHNIQLYYQNLDLMKEAQSRRTPCKFSQPNSSYAQLLLTPPDSHRKYSSASSNSASNSLLSTSSLANTPSGANHATTYK